MHTILAFDPGETTGVCVATYQPPTRALSVLYSGAILYADRHQALTDIFADFAATHVVLEDFRLYRGKAQSKINSQFPTVRVIGVIEYLAWLAEVPVAYQMALVRKRVQILPQHRNTVGTLSHRRDAYQHLRYFAVTQLTV